MNFFDENNTKKIFELLEQCQGVSQMEVHHPEGDVFEHSLQVLKWAFRETDDIDLILAAMLHDIGKVEDFRCHEQIAVEKLKNHATVKTLWLVEHHMRIWHYLLGEMRRLSKCRYFADHPWLPELVQLARWDKLGRSKTIRINYDKEKIIERLNLKIEKHFGKVAKEVIKNNGNS